MRDPKIKSMKRPNAYFVIVWAYKHTLNPSGINLSASPSYNTTSNFYHRVTKVAPLYFKATPATLVTCKHGIHNIYAATIRYASATTTELENAALNSQTYSAILLATQTIGRAIGLTDGRMSPDEYPHVRREHVRHAIGPHPPRLELGRSLHAVHGPCVQAWPVTETNSEIIKHCQQIITLLFTKMR